MTASLAAILSSSCRRKLKKKNTDDVNQIPIPVAGVGTMSQRFRDEKPMQPQRSRSNKMAGARNHHSESKLGRKAAPLAARTFTRLKSDNFLYCSGFSRVGENAKQGPRPVTRKESFSSTATTSRSSSFESAGTDDNDKGEEGTVQSFVIQKDKTPRRRLRRETSFYHKDPTRPSYHDRWHAALDSRDRSPTGLSRLDEPPRLARRGGDMTFARSHGQRRLSFGGSISTTTSSITTVSSISGYTLPIEHFGDVLSVDSCSLAPSFIAEESPGLDVSEKKQDSPSNPYGDDDLSFGSSLPRVNGEEDDAHECDCATGQNTRPSSVLVATTFNQRPSVTSIDAKRLQLQRQQSCPTKIGKDAGEDLELASSDCDVSYTSTPRNCITWITLASASVAGDLLSPSNKKGHRQSYLGSNHHNRSPLPPYYGSGRCAFQSV